MSLVHFHLILNHIPVLGTIGALLLLVAALVVKSADLRRAAYVAFAVVALCTIPVYFTGEPAEDAIRGFPGVKRAAIHEHEEFGEKSWIASGILGVLALGALVRWRRAPISQGVASGALVGAAVVSGMMAWTALLGGRVRHTEIRPGATAADATTIEPRRPRPGSPDSAARAAPAQP